jgi:hypothetical protein
MNRSHDRLEKHKQRMIAVLENDTYKDAPLKDKVEYWHILMS